MKKQIQFTIIAVGLCMFVLACKKELVSTAVQFAFLNVDNKTVYNANGIHITYNGEALNTTGGSFSNIKIPSGKGTLAFKDSLGTSLTDTSFNFEAGKTINWVLFQPSNNVRPVVLENNGSAEPQPDAGFIKVKFANFAPKAFTKPFDVVFYWTDPDTFDFIEGGRIENVATSFADKFSVLSYKPTTEGIALMLVDHETQLPLLDDVFLGLQDNQDQKRILTLFIFEPQEYGSPVSGTPYKIDVKTLFAN